METICDSCQQAESFPLTIARGKTLPWWVISQNTPRQFVLFPSLQLLLGEQEQTAFGFVPSQSSPRGFVTGRVAVRVSCVCQYMNIYEEHPQGAAEYKYQVPQLLLCEYVYELKGNAANLFLLRPGFEPRVLRLKIMVVHRLTTKPLYDTPYPSSVPLVLLHSRSQFLLPLVPQSLPKKRAVYKQTFPLKLPSRKTHKKSVPFINILVRDPYSSA